MVVSLLQSSGKTGNMYRVFENELNIWRSLMEGLNLMVAMVFRF